MPRTNSTPCAHALAGRAQEEPGRDVHGEAHEALPKRVKGNIERWAAMPLSQIERTLLADLETVIPMLWTLSCQAEKVRVALHLLAANMGQVVQPPAGLLANVTALAYEHGPDFDAYRRNLENVLVCLKKNLGVTP